MSEETELIKERLDLAELVGEYVQLKQTGRYFKALCPFHQEKSPSFIVSPDKGIWHCFGCQRSGDHFSFLQEMEKMEFPEALKMLAEKAGVELKQSGRAVESSDRRQRMFGLLIVAQRLYHEILMNMEAGRQAREYLDKRGVNIEAREEFKLGYAPKSWDMLVNFLRSRGFSPREMRDSGLIGESTRGKLYDRFRGRIMFPIADARGRVVAFGGRITPWCETGEEGKYINSPETQLYQKRQVVYNLDRAKVFLRGKEPAIVVEGYMDVVMLWQAGVRNVVASSGTAFTDEAIQTLAKFTAQLYFAFDADAAGAKAALMATERALAGGMRVATLVLPPGKDPADMVLESPEQLKAVIENPQSLLIVLLDRLRSEKDAGERGERLKEVLPFIVRITNPVFQGEMIQDVASSLHIPESVVIEQLGKTARPEESFFPGGGEDINGGAVQMAAEWRWLGMAIEYPQLREELWGDFQKKWIEDENARKLYAEINLRLKSDKYRSIRGVKLVEKISEDLQGAAEAARQVASESSGGLDVLKEGKNLSIFLKRRYLTAQLKRLQNRLSDDKYRGDRKILDQIQETIIQMGQVDS